MLDTEWICWASLSPQQVCLGDINPARSLRNEPALWWPVLMSAVRTKATQLSSSIKLKLMNNMSLILTKKIPLGSERSLNVRSEQLYNQTLEGLLLSEHRLESTHNI